MKTSFIMGTLFALTQNSIAAINPIIESKINSTRAQITVAVIDTGADTNHRDIKPLLWKNPGENGLDFKGREKRSNGIDDDDNGYVDDFHGWNFVDNNNDLLDTMGHGTHIAGVIAKQSGKSFPLKNKLKDRKNGVRLMILKYYDPNAGDSKNIENTVKALHYAIQMNARVINYSGGGSLPSKEELLALKLAQAMKITVVAAAGNNKTNTDHNRYYPANYGLSNIISVAATDREGLLVDFSNWGEKTVDIAAPGHRILSTLPHNRYGYMSGTSQATAFATGKLAAQILRNPLLEPKDAINVLIESAEHKRNLFGKTKYQVALVNSNNNEM